MEQDNKKEKKNFDFRRVGGQVAEQNQGRQGVVTVAESRKISGATFSENNADGRYGRQEQSVEFPVIKKKRKSAE